MTRPRTQRNAPCPCGSGRKYKRCCGNVVRDDEFARAKFLRAEMGLNREAAAWAVRRYGERIIDDAWDEFTMGILGPVPLFDEAIPFPAIFFPWWLYGGSMETGGDLPPVAEYLDDAGAPDDALERRLAEAIEDAPFSFHRVADVDPGRSMTLEDVMTGTRCFVRENAGSTEAARGAYLFARVLTFDGVGMMAGSGPFLIEPSWFPFLKSVRDELRQEAGRDLTEEDLHDFDVEIRAKYLHTVAATLNPAPPEMSNTDGDPLAPTRLIYELRCEVETAFDKLRTLAHGWKRSELLERADRHADGRMSRIEFDWIKKGGSKGVPGMRSTILGFLTIDEGRLEVEVNSRERADRIRRSIARRLGKDAKFRHAVVESIEKLMEESRGADAAPDAPGPGGGPDMEAPEIQEAVAKAMAEHWAAWLDHPIPALEGMTPREATRTAEGRELLEALLADFARKSSRMPDSPTRPDISSLRRQLGLDSTTRGPGSSADR